jgi:F-type H+-transporting ATPase subunit b
MLAFIGILAQEAGEAAEAAAENPLLPDKAELIYGILAFVIVFVAIWKFAMPQLNQLLDARTEKVRSDLERAETAKGEAESVLADYRTQLAGARDESNRIIEESRKTAEQLRRDLQAKAEQEASATVARAQEEIRAERDRVFGELRTQVGEIAVELAGRVVGRSLDKKAHEKLIDDYIEQVAAGDGQG